MLTQIFIFAIALFMVIRAATMATTYAARFAETLRFSKYAVGFFVVAVISILPETIISINAALENIPSFGLGMLLGSNIADLTLIIALVVFLSKRSLRVDSAILKKHTLYPLILLLPIILGLDGHFTRAEGAALVMAGILFYYLVLKDEVGGDLPDAPRKGRAKNLLMLLASLGLLLVGAHLTVNSATAIASLIGVSPVLIGMLIVGLGTTMPEFFFALNAAKSKDDSLAIGDILGTVLADATIVIGLLALISPFHFPQTTVYIGGIFMVAAALVLFSFMRSGRVLAKREAFVLVIFWVMFVLIELIVAA